MTNKKLRKALLEKLGITPQALSQRVQKLKKFPMTTEEATYLIAHREGVSLDKYLDSDTIGRIRSIAQQMSQVGTVTKAQREIHRGKTSAGEKQVVIKFPDEYKITDPILSKAKISEAAEMARIYPLLYVLENSIREVVDRLMVKRYGVDWWNSQAPKDLRERVSDRMSDDKKNSWHQRRGARPIDYLDFIELPRLARKLEKELVPNVIPEFEWFQQLANDVYKSRCVVCHMNPLDKDNAQYVSLRFKQWQKQINGKTI